MMEILLKLKQKSKSKEKREFFLLKMLRVKYTNGTN